MSAGAKWCNALYWLGLSVWLAALVTAAVAAMNVFTNLPDMEMALERFAAYPQAEHGRVAAGLVMSDVFFTVDLLQFVAVPLTVVCLLVQSFVLGARVRRPANAVRTLCVVVAALLFGYYALRLAPELNTRLHGFWNAAAAGEIDEAEAHRTAFTAGHRAAEGILRVNFLLVLGAIVASAVAQTPAAARSSPIEPPELLKRT